MKAELKMRRIAAMLTLALGGAMALTGCDVGPTPGDGAQPMGVGNEPTRQAATSRFKESYQLSNGFVMGPVHPTNIKTVHVEIFNSQTFYRDLEFRLTEALDKRILQDTPYVLANKDQADTILYGEITRVRVTLLGSDFASNLPKEDQPVLYVNWTWKNRRTGEILAQRVGMQQSASFIPLTGMTFEDAATQAVNDLAERIVEAMQADW
ncbi:MAG: hypothetical protein BIFFINMI_03112 [Phycisphaerae bacterium]|nr:hypothetical protein [Phycisphaerae bacterium]